MTNWGFDFRGWELSQDGKYYTVTEFRHCGFSQGDKVVVLCHGMGLFDVFKYEDGMPEEHDGKASIDRIWGDK